MSYDGLTEEQIDHKRELKRLQMQRYRAKVKPHKATSTPGTAAKSTPGATSVWQWVGIAAMGIAVVVGIAIKASH